jgi:hypothetical protein
MQSPPAAQTVNPPSAPRPHSAPGAARAITWHVRLIVLQARPRAASQPGALGPPQGAPTVVPAGSQVRRIAVSATGVHESPAPQGCVGSQSVPRAPRATHAPAAIAVSPAQVSPLPPHPMGAPGPLHAAPAAGRAAHTPQLVPVGTAQYPLWHCDA